MGKMRKILLSMICLSLITGLSASSVFANESTIYEETGQIELENLNFYICNSQLEISTKTRNASREDQEAVRMINENKVLKDLIVGMINEESVPIAVGYTTIYLKNEMQDDGTIAQVPMTKGDLKQSKAAGNDSYSPTKAFSLFTSAAIVNGAIVATSVGTYEPTGWTTQDELPQVGCYDYIGLAMPTQYTLASHGLSNSNIRSYTEDNTNNSVMMGVLLRPTPSVAPIKSIKLSGRGLKDANITNKKVISHYVHNWGSAKISVSLTPSGAGFSLSTVNKNWKVSSYVVI